MKALLPLLIAASSLAQVGPPPAPAPNPAASAWDTRAALVVSGSLAKTTAGDAYEDTLANAHTDPAHEDLAFGGAELFGRMSRDWADGRLEVAAAFHVHRHPGETTESELEEVYAEWSRDVLKLRAGIFLTPLGLTNTLHPHAWTFANAPLFYGRFLGSEGLRNPGAQVSWEADPGKSLWTLALQRATGDTAFSFRSAHEAGHDHGDPEHHEGYLGRPHDPSLGSGPLVTLRNERAYKLGESTSLASGISVAAADNSTGGATWIGAWDVEWRREMSNQRWLSFDMELLYRDYEANAANFLDDLGDPVSVAADRLQDLAVAFSVTTGLGERWITGVRAERAVPLDRGDYESAERDEAREARTRISPLLSWQPAEGLLLRLQYDHDRSPLFGTEDSVWLTVQWTLGKH